MLAAFRRASAVAQGRPALNSLAAAQSWAVGGWRCTSSIIRKRRRALHNALSDPSAHPAKLRKLKERSARPTFDLLRYIAENKIAKVQTQQDRKQLWYDLQYKKYAPTFLGQVKPRMRFWTAALEESQMPLARLPEVAVCGRSNSGKSTLVNYLCGRHSAHVKRMPGSTTELVFWQIGRPAQLCLVDLPGYGFANAAEEKRLQWTEFTLWYVRARKNLKRILLLIDARQGLKPSDREMIAYLERHSVPWQIVVTKCDTVKGKDLSKRLTIMQEEITASGYRRMAGDPIPVSALKRHGMDALRNTLDSLKVMKEVVKEGIKIRVYDLLEQRRLARSERGRRKRNSKAEAARAAAAAAAEGAETQEAEGAEGSSASWDEEGNGDGPDLHGLLSDWGGGGGSTAAHVGPANLSEATAGSEPARAPTVSVAGAHYSLEDRDSRRVDSFVQSLFPDMSELASLARAAEGKLSSATGAPATQHSRWQAAQPEANLPPVFPPTLGGWAENEVHPDEGVQEAESDSDDELPSIKPQVRSFDPVNQRQARAKSGSTRGKDSAKAFKDTPGLKDLLSPFPGLESLVSRPHAKEKGGARHSSGGTPPSASNPYQVGLRREWMRPPSNLDQLYEADDFVSPEDRAAGIRRWAPPSPTLAQPGQFMAQARKRYEREWSMELEDVDKARASAPDAGVASLSPTQRRKSKQEGLEELSPRPKKMPFITTEGDKPIPKGHAKWKFLGRPPAHILKMKKPQDPAKMLRLHRYAERRRTNLGSGLDWDDAKAKWMGWYKKNKKSRFDKIEMSTSPKKEDVEADYEDRTERRLKREARFAKPSGHEGGRASASSESRDEGSMPEWAGKGSH